MPNSVAMSRIEPSLEMPVPYMMSNSACLKGGATLFLTTLTRTRLPTDSPPSLMLSMRRISRRTEEKNLRARPPGVVSGLPNMTPIFSRSWLMKMQVVFDLEREPASLRRAWLMRRAWRPTVVSPISPSISALGTRAATESTTTTSTAPERTSMSQISRACSPVSGWEMRTSSISTPMRAA